MKKILIIARHGNTFSAGETPTRVGARTDLPLVEESRGLSVGRYLAEMGLIPDKVYAAPLKRTMQTAKLAVRAMGVDRDVISVDDFVEIDYGPDENRTEEEVMLRLGGGDIERGRAVIEAWNDKAVVPEGWIVDPARIIAAWHEFAGSLDCAVTLLVSSNGIIRFAPCLTGDFDGFAASHDLKVSTGGVCVFEKEDADKFWRCVVWNAKPYKN